MIKFPPGLSVAALLAVTFAATSPLFAQTADALNGSGPESGVDPTINPGDDFFAYANGEWLRNTSIPEGSPRVSARSEINLLTARQLAALLNDTVAAPAGTVSRKVADFCSAYLDQAAIESRGLAPVAPLLEEVAALKDKSALTRLLGKGMQADVDPLEVGVYKSSSVLGLSVEPGINGETTNIAFLLQGGLGLPDRENYLSADPDMQAQRAAYKDYIGKLLGLAGFDRPAQRADAVMALESAIARTQATNDASGDDHNAGNLWTREMFAKEATGMDWSEFFAAARLGGQPSFVAWQPSAVKGVAALVGSQPLEAWQDYLRFHVLDRYSDVLPKVFAEPAAALHGLPAAREERALAALQPALGDALGRMYSERYFGAEQKSRLEAVAANVLTALSHRVEAVTWMSPPTKAIALKKLHVLYVGLGYPEQWQDYSDFVVDPSDAAGNLSRGAEHNYRRALSQLGQPVDNKDWWMTPQTVGAILVFQQNDLNFPAALLQPPKYGPRFSDAQTYGAIGAIIGHESSHFIDPLGADYELSGRKHHWWTDDDAKQFKAASEPLVKEFSAYHPFPDLAINGNLTSSENIADLAGLSAAFSAYRVTLGTMASDKAYVRSQDRAFFIAFARSWRSKSTEKALRTQAATNDHAPEMYRVATVRNIDAWYDAFDVRPGDRLYLEPAARVKVW